MTRVQLLKPAALALLFTVSLQACAADDEDEVEDGHPLAAIPLRSIGPALTSGRVADFAFDPVNPQVHYVAMASGSLWKTENNGTSWTPVFEHEGAYSIGVVEIDPRNPNTVWVGTGENNSQRSVGFGDGVYRSLDGGRRGATSWNESAHLDDPHSPEDSNVAGAAQGPLWNSATAACTRPATRARPGRRSSTSTPTLASTSSSWTRPTPTSS
jgi:hypothetical protein